ncbi:MAG: hypothetical protein IKI36_04900 [Prevotella sp.]|nr:hypothetical protein [Prevotella sp.]
MESQTLAGTNNVITNVTGAGFGYGGGGSGLARTGESHLWDDEEEDSDWDQL